MNYKRQSETKYNHFFIGDENRFVLGFSKDEAVSKIEEKIKDVDEAIFPILMYDKEVFGKIMQLSLRDRKIITSSIEMWEEKQKDSTFVGLYWDIFTDFIFQKEDWTLFDLAKQLKEFEYDDNFEYEENQIYDVLNKMRKNTGRSIKKTGKDFASRVCALCKVSESILSTGRGTLYDFTDENGKYNIKSINAYLKTHENIETKKMIMEISGVKENDISEVPLQIVVDKQRIDNNVYQFIEILLNNMIKNGE